MKGSQRRERGGKKAASHRKKGGKIIQLTLRLTALQFQKAIYTWPATTHAEKRQSEIPRVGEGSTTGLTNAEVPMEGGTCGAHECK